MTPIDAYRAIQSVQPTEQTPKINQTPQDEAKGSASFQDVLGNLVKEVNGLQQDANRSIEDLVTGENTDVHDVTSRMAEAGVAFDLMMEVRNKLMDAYQQVMRMQA